MSRASAGAASAAPLVTVTRDTAATPALADQWEAEALDAISAVQDPAEAERLLGKVTVAAEAMRIQRLGEDRERRWAALRLRAERRYGELLGPAAHGGDRKSDQVTSRNLKSGERRARNQARAVAKIPQEEFNDYLASSPAPTREALVRQALRPEERPRPRQRTDNGVNLWQDDRVLAWVAKRVRAGRSRDRILEESKAGEHGWPLPDCHLSQNAADRVIAILEDRKRRGDTNRRRQPKESGVRLRQLHAAKRAGRRGDLWELQKAIAQAVGILEFFDLPQLDWTEETEMLVAEIYDDLERHARWNDAAIDAVTAHMGQLGRQRKIKYLRERADDPSSTQSERTTAMRLARNLEQKASNARLLGEGSDA